MKLELSALFFNTYDNDCPGVFVSRDDGWLVRRMQQASGPAGCWATDADHRSAEPLREVIRTSAA